MSPGRMTGSSVRCVVSRPGGCRFHASSGCPGCRQTPSRPSCAARRGGTWRHRERSATCSAQRGQHDPLRSWAVEGALSWPGCQIGTNFGVARHNEHRPGP